MANVEKMIAETFLEMAQGLESGSYGKRPKIALTGMGSEHGEENAMKAALMAAKDGVDVYYIGSLEAEGVTVTNEGIDKRIDYALKISGYDYLGGLKSFRDGLFFVQDISSMLASQGGFIKRDAYVIDVCAAPGGKSINAALMADIGHVSSRDISGRKVSLIKENAERLGIDNITYKVWHAVKKDEESVEKADVLICDLPCSGLGIIGRKPDIKYNVTYEKIKELALLQRKILSTVWEYVKKDGILIYSTCTVTPEENAENTEWLVNNYPFELIGKPEQIMPQDGTGDGFYIARLKRTE